MMMIRSREAVIAFVAICTGGIVGIALDRSATIQSLQIDMGLSRAASPREMRDFLSLVNQTKPVEVSCPARAIVFLMAGQSNAGNNASERYTPSGQVVNFYDGKCYKAADPLLGGTGRGGSVASRVGEIIHRRTGKPVVVAMASIGETTSVAWARDGIYHNLLIGTLDRLRASNLTVNYILWQQGESEFATPAEDYAADMKGLISDMHKAAPGSTIYIARSTVCGHGRLESIRRVQASVATLPHAAAGPDTDMISERIGNCHFTGTGADRAASMWVGILDRSSAGRAVSFSLPTL